MITASFSLAFHPFCHWHEPLRALLGSLIGHPAARLRQGIWRSRGSCFFGFAEFATRNRVGRIVVVAMVVFCLGILAARATQVNPDATIKVRVGHLAAHPALNELIETPAKTAAFY